MRRRGLSGAFWPDAPQHALLRVVLGPEESAAAEWRALQPLDVTALATGSFGLLPLLAERLAAGDPGEPRLPLLLGTRKSVWYRNQLLLDRLDTLAGQLAGDGVDAVLVGGAAALLRRYPGLARPVALLEVMVAPEESTMFRASARAAGWRHSRSEEGRSLFVDGDARVLVAHEGAPPFVAGRLGPSTGYRVLTLEPAELGVRSARMPALSPTDDVLFTCGMGARMVVPPGVQWLVDVHRALTSDPRPQEEALVERARAFRLVEHLRDTLAYLAEVAGGVDRYVDAVAREPVSRRDRLTLGLGGPDADGALVGVSLTVGAGLRSGTARSLPATTARKAAGVLRRRASTHGTARCRPGA